MSKIDYWISAAATALLLLVNWLAFHDVREAHTVRDWLTLGASILVFVHFAKSVRNQTGGFGRSALP